MQHTVFFINCNIFETIVVDQIMYLWKKTKSLVGSTQNMDMYLSYNKIVLILNKECIIFDIMRNLGQHNVLYFYVIEKL